MLTYRWEAEHVAPTRKWWGPSFWTSMRGESETPGDAALKLGEYGASGQRYRLVRSDDEVVLYVEAGWRK